MLVDEKELLSSTTFLRLAGGYLAGVGSPDYLSPFDHLALLNNFIYHFMFILKSLLFKFFSLR